MLPPPCDVTPDWEMWLTSMERGAGCEAHMCAGWMVASPPRDGAGEASNEGGSCNLCGSIISENFRWDGNYRGERAWKRALS